MNKQWADSLPLMYFFDRAIKVCNSFFLTLENICFNWVLASSNSMVVNDNTRVYKIVSRICFRQNVTGITH